MSGPSAQIYQLVNALKQAFKQFKVNQIVADFSMLISALIFCLGFFMGLYQQDIGQRTVVLLIVLQAIVLLNWFFQLQKSRKIFKTLSHEKKIQSSHTLLDHQFAQLNNLLANNIRFSPKQPAIFFLASTPLWIWLLLHANS